MKNEDSRLPRARAARACEIMISRMGNRVASLVTMKNASLPGRVVTAMGKYDSRTGHGDGDVFLVGSNQVEPRKLWKCARLFQLGRRSR